MSLANGKEISCEVFDDESLTLGRFNPSGNLVIIGTDENRAYIWEWGNNSVPRVVTLPAFTIMDIACDSDVSYVISENNTVCQVDLGSLQVSTISQGPSLSIPPVILPDGISILWVNPFHIKDMVVRSSLWEKKTFEADHPEGSFITAIDITSDGKLALSGSSSGTISLVNLESNRVVRTFTNAQRGASISLVCVLRNDTSFIVVDEANSVKLRSFDIDASVVLYQSIVKVNCVAALGLNYFLIGCTNGELMLFDYHKGTGDASKWQAHNEAVSQVKSHPSNEFLSFVSGSANGTVKLWRVTEAETPVGNLTWSRENVHLSSITFLAFVPHSEDIVCGCRDNHRLYRVNGSGIIRSYNSNDGDDDVLAVRVVNGILVVIILSLDGRVYLANFNLDDARDYGRNTVHYSGVYDQVSRVHIASGLVVSRGMNGVSFQWNLKTESIIRKLRGGSRDFEDVAFVPCGEFLLSRGVRDKTLRLWSLRTGCVIDEFLFDNHVLAFACASNGTVCVGLKDGQLCFLRLNNLP